MFDMFKMILKRIKRLMLLLFFAFLFLQLLFKGLFHSKKKKSRPVDGQRRLLFLLHALLTIFI